MSIEVNLLLEGQSDEYILSRILEYVGYKKGMVRGLRGKQAVENTLSKYNQAARYYGYWLAVVDLDAEDCPVTYVTTHLPDPASRMCFRVAVREIEAWLLADGERLARFLNISTALIPPDPESLTDPKQTLLGLVRRTRQTTLKRLMLPQPGTSGRVGPGYVSGILGFLNHKTYPWRPQVAAQNAESLRRCIRALERWH